MFARVGPKLQITFLMPLWSSMAAVLASYINTTQPLRRESIWPHDTTGRIAGRLIKITQTEWVLKYEAYKLYSPVNAKGTDCTATSVHLLSVSHNHSLGVKFEPQYHTEEKAERQTSWQTLGKEGREGNKNIGIIKLKTFLLATVLIALKLKL